MMLLKDEPIQNQHQENELARVVSFPTRKTEISERIMAKFAPPKQIKDSQYPQTVTCLHCNRSVLVIDENSSRNIGCNCENDFEQEADFEHKSVKKFIERVDFIFLFFILWLIALFIALVINHYSLPEIPKH